MTWVAVDAAGCDLATGRPPRGRGRENPAAALAAAPVMTWPLAVVGDDGRRLTLAAALGPGGEAVQRLLDSLAAGTALPGPPLNAALGTGDDADATTRPGAGLEALAAATPGGPARPVAGLDSLAAATPGGPARPGAGREALASASPGGHARPGAGREARAALAAAPPGGPGRPDERLEALAAATPGGPIDLPLAVVDLGAAVEASSAVDGAWLAEVGRRRSAPRRDLSACGRGAEMEAALHVALLLAAERLDPPDDADVDAHVASGARLWLLAGAVVSALAAAEPDPFASWARLVGAGWWPVGPSGGHLVVCAPDNRASPSGTTARAGARP